MRRALLALSIAAIAALPAAALAGEGGSGGGLPHAGSLGLAASLDSCGIAEATVVCKIDATFNEVPDAQYYTSSVTRPDGSVVDYGSVGGGSTSLWVPYAGNGDYTVQVSAYGKVKPDKPAQEIAKDETSTDDESKGSGGEASDEATATPGRDDASGLGDDDATVEPTPTCEEVPPLPEPDPGPTGPTGPTGTSGASGTTGLQAEAAAASDPAIPGVTPDQAAGLATQAELPQTVTDTTDCPDTAQATDGRCCLLDAG